jgi:hypothetical protein
MFKNKFKKDNNNQALFLTPPKLCNHFYKIKLSNYIFFFICKIIVFLKEKARFKNLMKKLEQLINNLKNNMI